MEDIVIVVSVLKFLCNSIQPMLIKPFVEVAVKFALERIDETNDSFVYDEIVSSFKVIFSDKDILDTNKSMLGKLVIETIQDMPISSDVSIKKVFISIFMENDYSSIDII